MHWIILTDRCANIQKCSIQDTHSALRTLTRPFTPNFAPGCSTWMCLRNRQLVRLGCWHVTQDINQGVGDKYHYIRFRGCQDGFKCSILFPKKKCILPFTHMLTVHLQVGALLSALQLPSSHCEIWDSSNAESLPALLIFIHSIHIPVKAYKLQIFLIWKLLRFMTPLAIYSVV